MKCFKGGYKDGTDMLQSGGMRGRKSLFDVTVSMRITGLESFFENFSFGEHRSICYARCTDSRETEDDLNEWCVGEVDFINPCCLNCVY